MPRSKSHNPFLSIPHVDLAYALARLAHLGATTVEQIRTLAAERKTEIATLAAQLAALEAGAHVDTTHGGKQGRAQTSALVGKRKVGRPKGSKTKSKATKAAQPGKPVVTVSKAVRAAQKLQGRYMGLRRHLSAALQVRATKIAQAKGVAAALEFVEAKSAKRAKKPVKKPTKMSPVMRGARKMQGRYLGLRRALSAELQAEATRIAQANGIVAALKFAEANRATSAA